MRRVGEAQEPESFDRTVRQPGLVALAEGREPLPTYWRKCIPDLLSAYDRICAYSCFRIPGVVGARTVEHFSAKSSLPALAYEWSNYRLVCALMNSRKREFDDVLDPFLIEDGWFELDFALMQVRPSGGLPARLQEEVRMTIDRLRLNDEEIRQEREHWYTAWTKVGSALDELVNVSAPFIYEEAVRQQVLPGLR